MFVDFFYKMRDVGIQVSPTAFLTLHRALKTGLIGSLNDFYTAGRAILVDIEQEGGRRTIEPGVAVHQVSSAYNAPAAPAAGKQPGPGPPGPAPRTR